MSGKVVYLDKYLYGLKKASRQWYHLLLGTLQYFGFKQCLVDPCVLRLQEDDKVIAMVVVHVEDSICAAAPEISNLIIGSSMASSQLWISGPCHGTWAASTPGIER